MTRTVPRPAADDVSAKEEDAASGPASLTVRMGDEDADLIAAAAEAAGLSPEAFMRSHAVKAAEAALLQAGRHRLSKAQWQRIEAILEEDSGREEETVELLLRRGR